MTLEHIKVHIENARDLIQLITEDVEGNFMGEVDICSASGTGENQE